MKIADSAVTTAKLADGAVTVDAEGARSYREDLLALLSRSN